ncbi:MAG: hypothetical protein K9L68_13490 [Spirochaetales bacterium]|nr:hypothetical protein [Spirochaetales bacterium]MCF7939605.1 hypothetical protein [Spirochaetales bacterium]
MTQKKRSLIIGILILLIASALLGGCYIQDLGNEGGLAMQISGPAPKQTDTISVDVAFFYSEDMPYTEAWEIYDLTEAEADELLQNSVLIQGMPYISINVTIEQNGQTEGVVEITGIPAGTYKMVIHNEEIYTDPQTGGEVEETQLGLSETFTIEAGKTTTVPVQIKIFGGLPS